MTSRTDITHNNTVEGIMYVWNRVVLHPSTLHSKIYRRIHKSDVRGRHHVTRQPSLLYLSLSHLLIIFNLDNPTALSRVDHSDKGIGSPPG